MIALNPGGALSGRNWPLEAYEQLAWRLAGSLPFAVQFVLLGLSAVAEKVALLKQSSRGALIDLVGRTSQKEAFAILARCSLMVSGDGGLMHAACPLGVPTLGFFGASRWVWARPLGPATDVIISCRESDGICMDGFCRAGYPSCLQRLEPELVHQAAVRLLAHSRAS